VLESCDWVPLFTSIWEAIEFFLTSGIIFSSDVVGVEAKKVLREKDCNLEDIQSTMKGV